MDSRRDLLAKLGLAAATLAAPTTAAAVARRIEPGSGGGAADAQPDKGGRAVVGSDEADPDTTLASDAEVAASDADVSPAPWWLLAPLRAGAPLAMGWSLADLSGPHNGGLVLRLQHSNGAVGSVHLSARAPGARPLATTHLLDLRLMDGGDGDRPTDETLGRLVVGLAQHIARNELAAAGDDPVLSALLPHSERLIRHGTQGLT
jgi:hypothetical protein